MALILPNDTERQVILGRTGSGKTQAGAFYLSKRSFDKMPWIIFNTKGDDLLDETGATEIDLDKLPTKPGLYMARPLPHEDEWFEAFLWAVWNKENCGLYFDEGYMIPKNSSAYRALLTQGRSKRVPIITLSQRPVWMDRFTWSEAEYINAFKLQNKQDITSANEMMPVDLNNYYGNSAEEKLPEYYSLWHDVKRDRTLVLSPVPDRATILSTFKARVKPKKVFI